MFYYLSLAVALFTIGVFGVLSRKGFLGKLVSFIIMSNALIVLFATFNRYIKGDGVLGLIFISFLILTVLIELLLGAYLVFQHFSKSGNNQDEGISLFS